MQPSMQHTGDVMGSNRHGGPPGVMAPTYSSTPVPILKEQNDVPLTHKLFTRALINLSEKLYFSFRYQVRLIVHGGAVMALHPSLPHRESAQLVDYIPPLIRIRVSRARRSRCRTTTTPHVHRGDRPQARPWHELDEPSPADLAFPPGLSSTPRVLIPLS